MKGARPTAGLPEGSAPGMAAAAGKLTPYLSQRQHIWGVFCRRGDVFQWGLDITRTRTPPKFETGSGWQDADGDYAVGADGNHAIVGRFAGGKRENADRIIFPPPGGGG